MNLEEISTEKIRRALLLAANGGQLQNPSCLSAALRSLIDVRPQKNNPSFVAFERRILAEFQSLFTTGCFATGSDLNNPNPPFFCLTERGKKAATMLDRDPANPTGYLAFIADSANLDELTESYISEALHAYNLDCFKASAVMVGAATECLLLRVRDAVAKRYSEKSAPTPKKLQGWMPKVIAEALKAELDNRKASLPKSLAESYEQYFPLMTVFIRRIRNEAGHPKQLEPVKWEELYTALLTFPLIAKFVVELEEWIANQM